MPQRPALSAAALCTLVIGILLPWGNDCPASVPAWGDSGATICQYPPCEPHTVHGSSDPYGVTFIWDDSREPGDRSDMFGTRLRFDGTLHPAWPVHGKLIAGDPSSQRPHDLLSDSLGNAFVLWVDFHPFEQGVDCKLLKIDREGNPAPGWSAEALRLSLDTSRQDSPRMILDGTGGAYVLWDDYRDRAISSFSLYMQHVTADGQIAPGWPRDGLPVCRAPGDSWPF